LLIRYKFAADDRIFKVHLLAISGISVAEGCLGYATRGRARAAPPQSSLVYEHNPDASLGGFQSRHAGGQAAPDDQHITIDDSSDAVHRAASGSWSFAVMKTTSIAFSGQTSSHKKQFTHCLFPNGKTFSFFAVKRITFAPQS
jgi:hypothetical protein